jgi:NADH-quinone oxidoreductase subunit A
MCAGNLPGVGTANEMWTLVVYFVLVLVLVAGMLAVSYLLGQRHTDPATGAPYESGILSEGSAHVRLSAKFYLIGMFFVIFDLEAVFLFAWAVAARSLGWQAFWEAVIFVGILVAALVYLWRIGALDWNEVRKHTE